MCSNTGSFRLPTPLNYFINFVFLGSVTHSQCNDNNNCYCVRSSWLLRWLSVTTQTYNYINPSSLLTPNSLWRPKDFRISLYQPNTEDRRNANPPQYSPQNLLFNTSILHSQWRPGLKNWRSHFGGSRKESKTVSLLITKVTTDEVLEPRDVQLLFIVWMWKDTTWMLHLLFIWKPKFQDSETPTNKGIVLARKRIDYVIEKDPMFYVEPLLRPTYFPS